MATYGVKDIKKVHRNTTIEMVATMSLLPLAGAAAVAMMAADEAVAAMVGAAAEAASAVDGTVAAADGTAAMAAWTVWLMVGTGDCAELPTVPQRSLEAAHVIPQPLLLKQAVASSTRGTAPSDSRSMGTSLSRRQGPVYRRVLAAAAAAAAGGALSCPPAAGFLEVIEAAMPAGGGRQAAPTVTGTPG